jgi:hypothetical protein
LRLAAADATGILAPLIARQGEFACLPGCACRACVSFWCRFLRPHRSSGS